MARAERFGESQRGCTAGLVMLLVQLLCTPLLAQSTEPVALAWNAPPGCSGASDVLGRVRELTKSSHVSEQQLHAEATITPGARGWLHMKLVLRAGNLVGERRIDGRSCEDLAGATAVVLALLLNAGEPLSGSDLRGAAPTTSSGDPSGLSLPTAGDPAASALDSTRVGQQTESQEAPVLRSSQGARTPRRWYGLLQLPLVSLGVGPLPRPSVGFSLAAGVLFEHWSLVVEGGAWLKQELEARGQPDSSADVHRVDAALRGCKAFAFGHFELAPCLRLSLRHLWARGKGLHVAPQTARATWLAVGAGIQARYHIVQWFSVVGSIDAHVETARPRVSIDGVGSLGQLWPAGLTISLGSEWIL